MNSSPHNALITKVAATALIIGCLVITLWAAQRVSAAWQFFAAESITQNMYDSGVFTASGLDQATVRLDMALAIFPRNPDYLGLAGHLKEIRASQPGVVGREQRDLLEAAADYHRQALVVRERWPYGWASLLSCKDKLGQVDQEFITAMHRTVELGPWEPSVQLQVLRSGMRHWDELKSGERALVRGRMINALKVQPREAFEIARFYRRPDLVCGVQTGQAQIERWCQG